MQYLSNTQGHKYRENAKKEREQIFKCIKKVKS